MEWFSSPEAITVANVLRVACILGAAVLIGWVIGLWHERPRMGAYQRARFQSLLWASCAVAGYEYERLNEPISFLLPLFLGFLATALYGVWGVRRGIDTTTP